MPIKPPNAPDYACHDCGHRYRAGFLARLFQNPARSIGVPYPPPKCPKCGSRRISVLMY